MPSQLEFLIAADHPALPGHFPGRPIVPGVVILDHVLKAAAAAYPGRDVLSIPTVKFLRPLLPMKTFSVELEPQGADKLRFRCHAGDDEFATGVLKLAETPRA